MFFFIILIIIRTQAENISSCPNYIEENIKIFKKITSEICDLTTDTFENSCAFKNRPDFVNRYKNSLLKFLQLNAATISEAKNNIQKDEKIKKYSENQRNILNIITNFSQNYPEVDFFQLQTAFIDQLMNYRNENSCKSEVKITESNFKVSTPFYTGENINDVRTFKEYEKLNKNELEKKMNLSIQNTESSVFNHYGTFEKSFSNQAICSKQAYISKYGNEFNAHVVVAEPDACPVLDVSAAYGDNQFDSLNADSLKYKYMELPQNAAFKKCYDQMLLDNKKISRVIIESSSSQLNNTSPYFCKKDFLALSNARAENAKASLQTIITNFPALESEGKVEISYPRPDGTSGECPYEIVNGKEILKKKFQSEEGRKSLDKNKYVKIKIIFDRSNNAITTKKFTYNAVSNCKKYSFSCM